ncbi:hypothetical protein FHT86_005609 [Rhizobium sp. BK313]|uniref:hypothetical protein n=1 Tax=Rhizobium sp. BK313 TaxID=2587081 RepID=UPI00105F13E1|nr:hypothetical protein [Rhizobium sp. BK313]MBB3457291.1 hypothetical protein [Rhizobium sp. BK313]
MNFDHIAEVLIHAMVGTLRSSIITIVLLLIGFPVSNFFSARTGVKVTAAFGIMCGMLLVSVASWYAFRFGISVKLPFATLIVIGTICVVVAGTRYLKANGPATIRKQLPPLMATAATFLLPVFAYSILSFAKIKVGALPLLTNGNGDLLAYLKSGVVLLDLPSATTILSSMDLRDFITTDVYGCFNLVAMSSFVLRVGVEKCAIPVMGVAIGLVALGIVNICQRVFALPARLAAVIAILVTTSTLFSYIVLCYFLAQMFFMGLLLVSILYIAEATNKTASSVHAAIATILICSATVMFVYHPWYVQYLLLASFAFGVALVVRNSPVTLRSFFAAGLASLGMLLAVNLFDLILGTSRYVIAAKKIIFAATADAGWPKPFVNLALLLGAPVPWQASDSYLSAGIQSLPVILVACGCLVIALKFDRTDNRAARLFTLGCFGFSTALYLVAWGVFGESYKQWKFASTLPFTMGFVVVAYILCLLLLLYRGHGARAIFKGVLTVIALCIVANITLYFTDVSKNAFYFRESLRDVAKAEDIPTAQAVYIDVPEVIERMAAAIYVNNKPIVFSRATNYGASSKEDLVKYTEIASLRQDCVGRKSIKLVTGISAKGADRMLPVKTEIDLAGTETDCLRLTGFSGSESWGRWTNGNNASLEATCECDLTKQATNIVLKAGTYLVPGKVERQRIIFRVNGSAPQTVDMNSMDKKDIVLAAPGDPANPSLLDVEMEFPDATSPARAGSSDDRLLGLAISSFSIVPKD